jgi:uncharacterized protein YeaO (DUF488 family)
MAVRIVRAYTPPGPDDGYRVLVDRVWPRGRSRAVLRLDAWERDLAPSDALRHWFGHDPERWTTFQERYRAELDTPAARQAIDALAARARTETVTLVYGATDQDHNQAIVLAELIEESDPAGP